MLSSGNNFNPEKTLAQNEMDFILKALSYYNNNLGRTAKALGVSRETIYRKLRKYKVKRKKDFEVSK